ncbi:MAG: hypothetical protein GYA18_05370 [Chloroflexi bacterium]|nr:hypothetical protein [Chloroflexota bacterium]
MIQKNSFGYKFLAFVLSLLFLMAFFPTLLSIPLEFVIMQPNTYNAMMSNQKLLEAGRSTFSDYIAQQLSLTVQNEVLPPVFSDAEVLNSAIKPFITNEWLSITMQDVAAQLLEFLNFKQPFGIVNISLTSIKDDVLTNKEDLVNSILNSSAPCNETQLATLNSGDLSIANLPLCNPPASQRSKVTSLIGTYVEEFIYRIPQEYQVNVEAGLNPNWVNPLLSYSIMRWTFRILPILLLVLLIGIAASLNKNKKEMRAWLGKLITSAAVLSLVLILVLVIGAEQFTAVFINNILTSEQGAFGILLLVVLQSITYQTLMWMGIIAAGFLCIGLLILFFSKQEKRVRTEVVEDEEEFQEPPQEVMDVKKAMIEETETDSSESENGE